MLNIYKTCNLNEVSEHFIEKEVRFSGWVFRKRDHGALLFMDLRDFYGILQIVFDTEAIDEKMLNLASHISLESVITVSGNLRKRSKETINHEIFNGNLELLVNDFSIESASEILPFPIGIDANFSEDMRLKFRFLDLRREKMKNNMILRSNVINEMRKFMVERGFLEFQTPILTASSPEGARDYLVPSRIHNGKFYALPQAPQIFKQLLMTSGFDKYFQIAPCFRDEDARADRSPGEFYQLDIEMSFVAQEEIFKMTENLLYHIFTKYSNKTIEKVFTRIKYHDSLLKYGTDKPDLRNPILITDVSKTFASSNFAIFKNNVAKGYVVRAIIAPGTGSFPRSFFDKQIERAKSEFKASGLAYINFVESEAKGPIAKFLSNNEIKQLQSATELKANDTLFFISEPENKAATIAGEIRKALGEELNLIDHNKIEFCWITDFPFFEQNHTTKALEFSHNPFSMPQGGMNALENEDPLSILAYQYDIVCNGIELSSGAIRNHKLDVLFKAFAMVGYTQEKVEKTFSSLINAFKFGPPPHGGIAPGIDRILMILADEPSIREVIAFPMNQKCEDLMMGAPSCVDEKQLKELKIKII